MASRRSAKTSRKKAAARILSAGGVRELASLIGRSPGTVSRWLRRLDWPFARTPPWNAAKVLAWANVMLAPNPAAQAQPVDSTGEDAATARLERQARAQVYAARAMLARQTYENRSAKLHDAEACRQRRQRQKEAIQNALQEIVHLAPALVGQPKEEIERRLTECTNGILDRFAAGKP
jgi:hypothetical protein